MTDDHKKSAHPPHSDGALAMDAHGRAALLLTESLIHALVDKKLLTLGEAVEIIDVATEVERDVAASLDGGKPPRLQPSLLAPLAYSLRGDMP